MTPIAGVPRIEIAAPLAWVTIALCLRIGNKLAPSNLRVNTLWVDLFEARNVVTRPEFSAAGMLSGISAKPEPSTQK